MTKTDRTVDCVALMRTIRDRLSRQFSKMSFEEQRQYMDEHLKRPTKPTGETGVAR